MLTLLKGFFDWCLEHWSFVLFVLGAFVEFTPAIKLNPFTVICKWIGNALNGEVIERVASLEACSDKQQKSIDENEMDRIRWEVLDFANACRNHRKHTKDEFQHIISINTKYHDLLDKYGEKNGIFDAEYAYILELYNACQHNNNFL